MTEKSGKIPNETLDVTYQSYQFGDTEFQVPTRYISLSARGVGAQGAVW